MSKISVLVTPGTVREMLYESSSLIVPLFLVHVLVCGGPPVVSPIRVKDGGSAMNDGSTRDIELVLITPSPTRLQTLHQTAIISRLGCSPSIKLAIIKLAKHADIIDIDNT